MTNEIVKRAVKIYQQKFPRQIIITELDQNGHYATSEILSGVPLIHIGKRLTINHGVILDTGSEDPPICFIPKRPEVTYEVTIHHALSSFFTGQEIVIASGPYYESEVPVGENPVVHFDPLPCCFPSRTTRVFPFTGKVRRPIEHEEPSLIHPVLPPPRVWAKYA